MNNEENKKLSKNVIEKYNIKFAPNELLLSGDVFINIDTPYSISETDVCFTIENKLVSVNIWKRFKIVQVIVFRA